jgi:hypothetical protein
VCYRFGIGIGLGIFTFKMSSGVDSMVLQIFTSVMFEIKFDIIIIGDGYVVPHLDRRG